jgi:hypothetical protein
LVSLAGLAFALLLTAAPARAGSHGPASEPPRAEVEQLWSVHLSAGEGTSRGRSCCALAERGDLVVVGDAGAGGSGSAAILERDRSRGGWHEALPLVPRQRRPGDRFGAAVSVDGELALVGAPGRGAAIVFRYDRLSEAWIEEARLQAEDRSAAGELGFSVSLHGQRAAVGAPAASGATGATGAVYVFRRDARARSWRLEQRIAPSEGAHAAAFGAAVALAGDLLVVGAPLDVVDGEATGSVRAFRRDGASGRWQEEEKLVAGAARRGDGFGFSVALQGRTAVIGAPAHAAGAAGSGGAYVFDRDPLGTWREETRLLASDPARDRGLGAAVALRGERALAIAGDGTAAYLFARQGGEWSEESKLGGAPRSGDSSNRTEGARAAALVERLPIGLAARKRGGGSGGRTLRTFAVAPKVLASCTWIGGSADWDASTANWSCGVIPGSGDDVTINTNVIVSVSSAVTVHDLTLSGTFNTLNILGSTGSMTTTGTFNWSAGQVNFHNAATWTNQNVFDVQADSLQMFPFGGEPNTLINNGTLKKSGGAGGSNIHVTFQSTGTLDAQSGQLNITGGTTATYTNPTLTASLGATLNLGGSKTHTFAGTATGNPAGTVQLAGGAVQAAAGGATINLGNQGFAWSDGSYSGANVLTNAGRFRFVTGNTHLINTATLTNAATGTMEWTGVHHIQMCNVATLNNQGTFDIQADGLQVLDCGGQPNTVNNSGTLKKSAGVGASTFFTTVQNTGTLDVQSGSLSLNGNGTYTNGTLTSSLGAGLFLANGTHVFSGTVTGNPAGAVEFGGTTLQAGAGGGTLNLGGEGFRWSAGTYTGANVLTNTGRFRFVNGNTHLINTATLTNAATGTMEWTGVNHIQMCNVATLNNQGTFDIQADGLQVLDCGGQPNTINNSGTFKKSAGSSGLIVFTGFNNLNGGILEASGTAGSSIGFATLNHNAGAILRGDRTVGPGTMTNAGITAPGLSPGQLTVAGNWNPTASAVLRIEMQGLTPVTHHDQLAVQGTATLGGTVEVSFLNGYLPAVGDPFVVLTCTTACTGTFAAVTAPQGRHFDVTYNPTNVTLVMNNVIDNAVFSDGFESGTKAAWSASTPP